MTTAKLAPDFAGALAWLNVDRPISMRELRGCLVIVDFWTYCCVNCMHVLPVLRAIEERYAAEPLVVIGVHSGKFTAERNARRIREAIGRYGVPHPVAVDDEMAIWSRYGIRSWPTLVIVRPDGTIAAVAPGEPDLGTLDAFVRRELDLAREQGTLAAARPILTPARPAPHQPLSYPGKVRVLPDGRLCISDSGHHRVLLCAESGRVELTIGCGLRGWQDGPLEDAAFDDPQGVCWHEGALYVADVRNHCLRRVDLEQGEVTTVAGTGELGGEAPTGLVAATETALRSPWDLCSVGGAIYVAMAGSHQIWRYWPAEEQIEVYAGTGVEALLDGPVAQSAWAQPSGLSEARGLLYVADSETSAVRAIDLGTGTVGTLLGEGLFDFGDREGEAQGAMLQHCLGVEAVPDGLLIADTYNGKIKWLGSLAGRSPWQLRTMLDDLAEPGAVAVEPDGAWAIANTNAHEILRVQAGVVTRVPISGAPEPLVGALRPPVTARPPACSVQGWFSTLLELEPGAGLRPGSGRVVLRLRLPAGVRLAAGSSIAVDLAVSRRSDLLILADRRLTVPADGAQSQTLAIDVHVLSHGETVVESELVAMLRYTTCEVGEPQACQPATMHLRVPVRLLAAAGQDTLALAVELPEPAR
jgi:thiol-disulfide isomerase/thioredoxin